MACKVEEVIEEISSLMNSKITRNSIEITKGNGYGKIITKMIKIGDNYSKVRKTYQNENEQTKDTAEKTNNIINESKMVNRKGEESSYTNHTGGAYGADSIWANLLRPKGIINNHYRPIKYPNSKRTKELASKKDNIIQVTKEESIEGSKLNKSLNNGTHDLNNRNLVQVYNADTVFAVAEIKDNEVIGGTGSAVRMADSLEKDVYVLNTVDAEWYTKVKGVYTKMDYLPKFTNNFAAIGTRGIEEYNTKNKDGKWVKSETLKNTDKIISKMKEAVENSFKGKEKEKDKEDKFAKFKSESEKLAHADEKAAEIAKEKEGKPTLVRAKQKTHKNYNNLDLKRYNTKDELFVYNGQQYKSVFNAFSKLTSEKDTLVQKKTLLRSLIINQYKASEKFRNALLKSKGEIKYFTLNKNDDDYYKELNESVGIVMLNIRANAKRQSDATKDKEAYKKNVQIVNYNYDREKVAKVNNKVFLFGDNTNDRVNTKYIPTSTQAVIRGLDNTLGIDTKKNRKENDNSYFTDSDINEYKDYLDNIKSEIIKLQKSGQKIVLPSNGIGTGKAQLKERAPLLYNALATMLNEIANKEYMELVEIKENTKETQNIAQPKDAKTATKNDNTFFNPTSVPEDKRKVYGKKFLTIFGEILYTKYKLSDKTISLKNKDSKEVTIKTKSGYTMTLNPDIGMISNLKKDNKNISIDSVSGISDIGTIIGALYELQNTKDTEFKELSYAEKANKNYDAANKRFDKVEKMLQFKDELGQDILSLEETRQLEGDFEYGIMTKENEALIKDKFLEKDSVEITKLVSEIKEFRKEGDYNSDKEVAEVDTKEDIILSKETKSLMKDAEEKQKECKE